MHENYLISDCMPNGRNSIKIHKTLGKNKMPCYYVTYDMRQYHLPSSFHIRPNCFRITGNKSKCRTLIRAWTCREIIECSMKAACSHIFDICLLDPELVLSKRHIHHVWLHSIFLRFVTRPFPLRSKPEQFLIIEMGKGPFTLYRRLWLELSLLNHIDVRQL